MYLMKMFLREHALVHDAQGLFESFPLLGPPVNPVPVV